MSEPIRVLQCVDCVTLEVLPLHGEDALEYLDAKHKFPDHSPHYRNLVALNIDGTDGTERPATFDDWEHDKEFRDFVKRMFDEQVIQRPGQGAGLGTKYYDAKNTFQADAMTCYGKHLRPKAGCHDYRRDSKRLVPDTAAERKAEGLAKPTSNRFLCDFCPVHIHATTLEVKRKKLDT